jgi:uncharacterized protein (TIGR03435 family)
MRKAILGTLTAALALAQSATHFEVASVKLSPPNDKFGVMDGGPLSPGPFNMGSHDPNRITWTNTRLIRILMMAYDLPADRISGPGWLESATYDIVATVPPATTVPDFKLMVQNLLADRFKLTLHRETKEVSGYSLELANSGPKLRPIVVGATGTPGTNPLTIVDQSGFPAPRPGNPMYLPGAGFSATIKVDHMYRATVLNQSMPTIANFLGTAAGMPVEDHTGLTGLYDFHLEYKPNLPTEAAGDPAPDLFDAIQTQLGLKLVKRKVPQETLVIDHAEKIPTGN